MAGRCIVPGCNSGKRKTNRPSFHHLPFKDAGRCEDWLRLIKNPKFKPNTPLKELKEPRVCSLHFREEDFDGHKTIKRNAGFVRIRRLKSGAKPSIFGSTDDEESGEAGGVCGDTDATESDPKSAAPAASTHDASGVESRDQLNQSSHSETDDSSLSTSSEDETESSGCGGRKAMAYQSNILELFKVCQTCGNPISDTSVSFFGALMSVRWGCAGGHSGTWSSSPVLRTFLEKS
ncbi:uncharacterized protein [Enoplosus armatus]|uniref:uncharacterized protein n=1 Tax=Enoplosus armatus TaxID=215367 RepID=UPI0039939272